MIKKVLGKVQFLALAAGMVFAAGSVTNSGQAFAQSAASVALATHCSGSTRSVFRTTRAYNDFLVSNARQLTGRTFQQDLIDCATALPGIGIDGFGALQALHAVCLELRASPATCNSVKRQQNFYVTIKA